MAADDYIDDGPVTEWFPQLDLSKLRHLEAVCLPPKERTD